MTPLASAPASLYIHIPFCVSLCPYCDFVVYAGAAARGPKARLDAFLEALHVELDLRADALDAAFGRRRPALATVYLGGGTPSLLGASAVRSLLDQVRARFRLGRNAEVTIEANPGPEERGDAQALRMAGINRISLGAQAMSTAGLRRLGRRHRVADVGEAVRAARDGGIASISLDLLYDAPDASLTDWIDTLDAAMDLAPDHLSLYALTLDDPDAEGLTGPGGDHLPTTAGARRWRDTARPRQDEDRAAAQYHHA
ncbi:MAG: radical SAM protein, partial [Chloroflexi bacterium]|nr:radical SAM protein [Chloroflexota bacterium]